MKVLVYRNYNQSYNNHIAELQLLIGLQKKGVDITYIGEGKIEHLNLLHENNIHVVRDFPTIQSKSSFKDKLQKFIIDNKFDILHLFIAKQIRESLPAVSKLPIKVITYFGSSSLHWHDPSAYLTLLSPRVDKIICNSDYVYQHVRKQLFGKNKAKAIRIYKGYGEHWFDNVTRFDYTSLGIPKNAIIICTVARNTKVKGVKYFLKAAELLSEYKNAHYIVIGNKNNTPKVRKSIAKYPNSENIHLLGHRTDVMPLVNAADIYTQTSLSEGFGRAISEAMCLSKPIVMTDAGGCTELIEDGKSGFIVAVKAPKAIAKAWKKLIDDSRLRIAMGANARERMLTTYNIQTTIDETFNLYQNIV